MSISIQEKLIIWSYYWIEVWGSGGIQMVLNKISHELDDKSLDFEKSQWVLRWILEYPWIWDEGNISRFIDIFHIICRRFSKSPENKMTLIGTWKMFNDMRFAQEMEWVTISVENDVISLLKSEWKYSTAAWRVEWRWVRI